MKAMIAQAFGEESKSRTLRPRPKGTKQVRSKVMSFSNIFFDTKGVFGKELFLADQTVNS
jgi:hypothetical protein